ncbi:hypothetical protein [Pedobacter sp. G11]|uniref:hypothetical protein n=1 Tax=Pedobacter sp. G11 TaxID=2482728 RepID=UPI001AEF3D62|nr:hypothetical protein [Pedobacter sp. G11]
MAKVGITLSSDASNGDLTALVKDMGSKAAEGLLVGATEGWKGYRCSDKGGI